MSAAESGATISVGSEQPVHPSSSSLPSGSTSSSSAPQRLLILVGVVGSGKSTFALSLCSSHPSYVRSNQDLLGHRRAVLAHVRQTLRKGLDAVVDRTNVDVEQRAHWIRLAGEMDQELERETRVHAVVFDTPFKTCEDRLKLRTDHETLSPDRALEVLRRFSDTFSPPSLEEGFDGIHYLRPSDMDGGGSGSASGSGPSAEQLEAFLRRLDEAEREAERSGRVQRNVELRRSVGKGGVEREGGGAGRGRGRGRGAWRRGTPQAPQAGYGGRPQDDRGHLRGAYSGNPYRGARGAYGGQGYPPPSAPPHYAPNPQHQGAYVRADGTGEGFAATTGYAAPQTGFDQVTPSRYGPGRGWGRAHQTGYNGGQNSGRGGGGGYHYGPPEAGWDARGSATDQQPRP